MKVVAYTCARLVAWRPLLKTARNKINNLSGDLICSRFCARNEYNSIEFNSILTKSIICQRFGGTMPGSSDRGLIKSQRGQ